MKELTVPIDQAGRIVLPKGVREELAIKGGDTLRISVHGASVTLTPDRQATGLVRKGKALVFSTVAEEKLTGKTVNDVLEQARSERDGETVAEFRGRKQRA